MSYLGEQLRHRHSETVYLDFSKTSMSFSQLRAKMRGTLDIVWVIDWIESIRRLGLGKFDFVGCTGVLHHLKNPQTGLNTLGEAQSDNGGAEFMVYGSYGRTGIYQIQNLMRIINQRDSTMKGELKAARYILNILPADHWFRHIQFSDVQTMGDTGIYDLLLHKRDVSYTIRALYEWVCMGGYKFVDHSLPENRLPLSIHMRINSSLLFSKLAKKDISAQETVSEIMVGNIKLHDAYASKIPRSEAILKPGKGVVYAQGSPTGFPHVINNPDNHMLHRKELVVVAILTRVINHKTSKNGNYKLLHPVTTEGFIWPSNEFNNFVLTALTKLPNRPKCLLTLIQEYNDAEKDNITIQEGSLMFEYLFFYLKMTGVFYVRHRSIPEFPLTCCSNQYSIVEHNSITDF